MLSPELKADLSEVIKKLVLEFDHPEFNVDTKKATDVSQGHHVETSQPYRFIFSRSYDADRGSATRILSVSWIGGKPFSDHDIPEWQALVENIIGVKLGQCGFMFMDKRRLYCLWPENPTPSGGFQQATS